MTTTGCPSPNRRGLIRQSLMAWCFPNIHPVELARHAKSMGIVAMEGMDASHFAAVRDAGLAISLVLSYWFDRGPVQPANHEHCLAEMEKALELCGQHACRQILVFTGLRESGMSETVARENCVTCWKQILPLAEARGVTLCLEHLNSRDTTHPMKGHPGYFGDDLDRCVDMIRACDSPHMKLLFDIYHVQVMHGDVIRRLRQHQDLIHHYHIAGNPGRGEPDHSQEINYPAVLRAIADTGFAGYVAQEFLPTWDDPLAALREAVAICDV
ncbi:MAG TPA: TIM barrel protein [Pirellulaceae bacterium]